MDTSFDNIIKQEQTKQLFQVLPVSAGVALLLALLLAYFARTDVAPEWVVSWLALFSVISLYRFGLYWQFNQVAEDEMKHPRWRNQIIVSTLALGFCWMFAVFSFLPQMSLANQALSNILFAGVAAGAISGLSYIFFVAAIYVSFLLIPLAITMGLSDSGLASVAIMAVLFLASLLLMSKRFSDAFQQNIKMGFEATIANKIHQEADNRLGLLFSHSPLAILEWDADLNVTQWNPSAEAIFGISKADILGRSILLLLPEETKDEFKRFAYDLLLEENNQQSRFECLTSDGRKKKTQWYATKVVVDQQISTSKFAAQIVDISEEDATKNYIKQKEQRYEHMLKHVPVVIYVCQVKEDGSYPAIYVSNNIKELFGFSTEEYFENPDFWPSHIHPDDKERVFEGFGKLFEFGSLIHEYRFQMPNGRYEWIRDELNLLRDESGKPAEFIGSWIKYEDTKQTYLALERFKDTLDMTLDCVFMFDAEKLKYNYINKGATNQVGYTVAELRQMHPYDIKPEFNESHFKELIKPLLDKTESQLSFETVHRHRDGHDVPVEIFLQYVELENKNGNFVAIVRDISERRRVERMKEAFISTVSHELRTPLTSVFGSLSLLRLELEKDPSCNELASRFIEIAYNNSVRLTTLINDIIDMDKISNGVLEVYLKPVSVLPLVKKSIEDNVSFGEQYGVRFSLKESSLQSYELNIDSARFLQVMTNLLSNAAKYTHKDDEVLVSVEPHYENIRIAVTDHGEGIPEEIGSKIFDRFVQVDSTDTRAEGGSGLGLSISHDLVEKMNGKIGYFPNPHGRGTTFYIDFPQIKNGVQSTP